MIQDSGKVEYDAASGKLWVLNSRLCNVINKILKTYENGEYFFLAGEEAVFKVPQDQLNEVLEAINAFQ
jgi:alpha-amylase/alpha-mannosidase (GH57 family)